MRTESRKAIARRGSKPDREAFYFAERSMRKHLRPGLWDAILGAAARLRTEFPHERDIDSLTLLLACGIDINYTYRIPKRLRALVDIGTLKDYEILDQWLTRVARHTLISVVYSRIWEAMAASLDLTDAELKPVYYALGFVRGYLVSYLT